MKALRLSHVIGHRSLSLARVQHHEARSAIILSTFPKQSHSSTSKWHEAWQLSEFPFHLSMIQQQQYGIRALLISLAICLRFKVNACPALCVGRGIVEQRQDFRFLLQSERKVKILSVDSCKSLTRIILRWPIESGIDHVSSCWSRISAPNYDNQDQEYWAKNDGCSTQCAHRCFRCTYTAMYEVLLFR